MATEYQKGQEQGVIDVQTDLKRDAAADLEDNAAAFPITDEAREARDILDTFLFEEINNNRNPVEDEWAITWVGDDFILRNYESGKVYNFRVSILPGTLSADEIRQAGDDQEWWEDDE